MSIFDKAFLSLHYKLLYIFIVAFLLFFILFKIFFSENKIEIKSSSFEDSFLEKVPKKNLLAYELVFFIIISLFTRITKFILSRDIPFIAYLISYFGISPEVFQIIILIISFIGVNLFINSIPLKFFQFLQKKLLVSVKFWIPVRVYLILEDAIRTNPYVVIPFIWMFFLWALYSFPNDNILLLGQFSFIFNFFQKIKENLCAPVVYQDGILDEKDLFSKVNSTYSKTSFIEVKKPLIFKTYTLSRTSYNYIMTPWVQKRSIIGLIGTVSRAVSNHVSQGVIAVGGVSVLGGGIFWGIDRLDYKMAEEFSAVKDHLEKSSQRLESMREHLQNDSISSLSLERRKKAGELIKQAIDEENSIYELVLDNNNPYSRILNSKSLHEAKEKAKTLKKLTSKAGLILADL